MFAISSDLDHAISLPAYLEFMKYLNTSQDTCYGRGLDLEISNSFWFFNTEKDNQLSYFQGLSTLESKFAGVCRELWKSGHIDTLHSYGNFNRGDFRRSFAEKALEALDKHGVDIPVWVNHGNDNNLQNIGDFPFSPGANPASKAYHFDLLKEYGLRFFWTGRTTHVSGQDTIFSLGNYLQRKLQNLALKTKYRKVQRPLPDPANRLLMQSSLEDGNHILEFQRFISRYGEVKNTDIHDLGLQLTRGNLSSLVKSEGYMLLYTHMNENLPESQALPVRVEAGFRRLAEYSQQKVLLVTTTSRLLQYADTREHLGWKTVSSSGLTEVHFFRDDKRPLTPKELQGVTLYCTEPEQTALFCGEERLSAQTNPADSSGRSSLSVVWEALEFPV